MFGDSGFRRYALRVASGRSRIIDELARAVLKTAGIALGDAEPRRKLSIGGLSRRPVI